MKSPKINIAYFISPHGFGHAARSSAVMEALRKIYPEIAFEIFTTVPEWFFKGSFSGTFHYHKLITDIGMVQKTPLKADIPETIRQLDHFLPFNHLTIKQLAEIITDSECSLTICDIAPMGIEVARIAGIPSILIENFTWDWLYENYAKENTGLKRHIEYMKELFHNADYHIQTEPVCCPCNADLTSLPVSRDVRNPVQLIRTILEVPETMKMIVITMGGVQEELRYLRRLFDLRDIYFVIPGSMDRPLKLANTLQLSQRSDLFHPDLLNACDAVIGKVGYSTLSEVFYAGVPFGYISRRNFRESEFLVSYIKDHMPGISIDEDSFYSGDWLSRIPELLCIERRGRNLQGGASQVAQFICSLL